jgi:hypothetical protein
MNALLLALSLSNTFTKVGAIVAFAGLLGIAILSMLVFSQAREIKRLREWAGRAPERAQEEGQRVSADAAARMQRATTTPAARAIPRKTPLVSAPVSTAVHASATAAVPSGAAGAVQPEPVGQVATAASPEQPEPSTNGSEADEGSTPELQSASVEGEADASSTQTTDGEKPAQADSDAEPGPSEEQAEDSPVLASAPSTPAAQTAAGAAASARSPLPPSPSAPAPPGSSPEIPAGAGRRPAARPPAPLAATRRTPSRATSAAAPVPTARVRGAGPDVPASNAGAAATAGGSGPKYFKPERSSGRLGVWIVAGVVVVVLVIVLVSTIFKGGGSAGPAATRGTSSTETTTTTRGSHAKSHATLTPRAETSVAVLNGTSTAGLAHHLASDLQQTGYSLAEASTAVPPGTHPTTVVEYSHGHRDDAQAVAKTLDVREVQAMDSTTTALAGSADVVVLAGADQASQLGGGGAQSNGEPAATGAGATEGAVGTGQ